MSRLRDIIRREAGETPAGASGPVEPVMVQAGDAAPMSAAGRERLAHPLAFEGPATDPRGKLPWLESAADPFEDETESDKPLIARKWLILGGLAFLALLAAVALAIYSRSAKMRSNDPLLTADSTVSADDPRIPLIEAPKSPVREKPLDQGGMPIADQDKTIYDVADGQVPDAPAKLAAAEEQPVARAQIKVPPITTAEPVPALTPVPALVPEPKTEAKVEPKPAKAKPAPAKEAEKPAVAAKPAPAPKITPVPALAPAPVAAAPSSAGGLYVQLGSFSSRDRALAAWTSMSSQNGLSGLSSDVVEKAGQFKLRAGPVGNAAKAKALCAQLAAAGQGCFIAK